MQTKKTSKGESSSEESITVGDKVYAKLAKRAPERVFTVRKIIDKTWIQVQDPGGGAVYTITRKSVHIHPVKKKPPSTPRSRSVHAISTPMGGQPPKRQRGYDSLDDTLREHRLLKKRKKAASIRMNAQEIKERLERALDDFIGNDADLLIYNANERAIAHKLAEHMGRYFQGWDIDCEYNRIGRHQQGKLIHYSRERFMQAKQAGTIPDFITSFEELQNSEYAVPVYPDIIVHQRGNPTANLLIVEMKKSNNPDVILGWDQWKIQFFRTNLNYEVGVFISFNVGDDAGRLEDRIQVVEWFM